MSLSRIFKIVLYDTNTGLNALKQKNVKFSVGFEKCISVLTYFVPTLMILRMSLHNDQLYEFAESQRVTVFSNV